MGFGYGWNDNTIARISINSGKLVETSYTFGQAIWRKVSASFNSTALRQYTDGVLLLSTTHSSFTSGNLGFGMDGYYECGGAYAQARITNFRLRKFNNTADPIIRFGNQSNLSTSGVTILNCNITGYQNGIILSNTSNGSIVNTSVYTNTQYGIYVLNSNRTSLLMSHLFNNSFDFGAKENWSRGPLVVNFSRVVFDNPLGNYANYSNISINTTLYSNSEF